MEGSEKISATLVLSGALKCDGGTGAGIPNGADGNGVGNCEPNMDGGPPWKPGMPGSEPMGDMGNGGLGGNPGGDGDSAPSGPNGNASRCGGA